MIKEFDNNKTLVCAVYDIYENDEPIADDNRIYEVDKTMSYDDIYKAVEADLKKRYPHYEIDLWSVDTMKF